MAVDALIENAVKFTEDGDGIVVRATAVDDTWLAIEVADTGVGIESEDLSRVFERFARGSGRQTQGPRGTGLGSGDRPCGRRGAFRLGGSRKPVGSRILLPHHDPRFPARAASSGHRGAGRIDRRRRWERGVRAIEPVTRGSGERPLRA